MPTIGSRQDLVPPQEKNTREITAFAVNLSLRSLTFPPPKPRVDPQWEDTENKSAVITYVAGGAALVWLSGTVVGAINSIPILPKVMELVGLGYSTWFVYRYVLYKDSRKELVERAKGFEETLRHKDLTGEVTYMMNGSRMRMKLMEHKLLINFQIEGVKAPNAAKQMGGKGGERGKGGEGGEGDE